MLRPRGGRLVEIGVALVLVGGAVLLALALGALLKPLAMLALIAGIVLIAVGALANRQREPRR